MAVKRILAVCTGNICRSPAVERMLAFYLSRTCVISSAGTGAVVGAPIEEAMAQRLRKIQVSCTNFSARQISATMIGQADLILTATRAHRSKVVALEPMAIKRTFTVMEFARSSSLVELAGLAGKTVPERMALLTDHVYRTRPHLRLPADEIDIPDPFNGPDEGYELAFSMIFKAVSTIVYQLTAQ